MGQDLCLKVTSETRFGTVEKLVQETLQSNKPDHTRLTLNTLDIYQRPDDTDHKQITFSVQLASYERTLTSKDLSALMEKVAAAAKEKRNAEQI